MSIQVRCNGCDGIIDTSNKAWFEAAYFDPNDGEELDQDGGLLDDEAREQKIETQKVYHFCSPGCVSAWGMHLAMEEWTGPVA